MMNKLSPEDQAVVVAFIALFWMAITTALEHEELWVYPFIAICAFIGLHMIVSMIRDIYNIHRRDRTYERAMLERLYWLESEKDKRD